MLDELRLLDLVRDLGDDDDIGAAALVLGLPPRPHAKTAAAGTVGFADRRGIVDDDAAFGSILDGYLQTAKFRTLRLGTGSELFALLASRPPDVIILDLTLPDEDGLAITRRVRARSSVPIIIVTGRQNSDDRLAGLEVGAISDVTPQPHNGCRPPKRRRV